MDVFSFIRQICRSSLAGLYSECTFHFLRYHQNVIGSGCIILHFHQQYTRILVSLHSGQHAVLSVAKLVLLINTYWDLIVVVCISLRSVLLSIFLCTFWHSYAFFGEASFQIFCLFKNLGCLLNIDL